MYIIVLEKFCEWEEKFLLFYYGLSLSTLEHIGKVIVSSYARLSSVFKIGTIVNPLVILPNGNEVYIFSG